MYYNHKNNQLDVHIADRVDLLSVMLRFVRYMFSDPNTDYYWHKDPKKSTISVQDVFAENTSKSAIIPAITLSMGGQMYNIETLGNNQMSNALDSSKHFVKFTTAISVDVIGRNKLEAFRLTDTLANFLFLFKGDLMEHCTDITNIENIQVSPIQPSQQYQSKRYFEGNVSFAVEYKLAFNLVPLAQLFTEATFSQLAENELNETHERKDSIVSEEVGPILSPNHPRKPE